MKAACGGAWLMPRESCQKESHRHNFEAPWVKFYALLNLCALTTLLLPISYVNGG